MLGKHYLALAVASLPTVGLDCIRKNTGYDDTMAKIEASANNRAWSPVINRYIEGPFSEVVKGLNTDAIGALSVELDGVLRSFAGNLKVIDYRQLDPEQVRWFGKQQLGAWSNDAEIPDSVSALVQGTIDGRLVVNEELLLHPSEKPQIGKKPSSTQSEKRNAEDLFIRQSATCADTACESFNFVYLGVAMLATSQTAHLTVVAWIPTQTYHLGEFGVQSRI